MNLKYTIAASFIASAVPAFAQDLPRDKVILGVGITCDTPDQVKEAVTSGPRSEVDGCEYGHWWEIIGDEVEKFSASGLDWSLRKLLVVGKFQDGVNIRALPPFEQFTAFAEPGEKL